MIERQTGALNFKEGNQISRQWGEKKKRGIHRPKVFNQGKISPRGSNSEKTQIQW